MSKSPAKFMISLLIISLFWGPLPPICAGPAFGMGLGDIGGGQGDEITCTPDDPLVILPGPMGSPVRLTPFDSQTYLVADYSRRKLFWYSRSGTLTQSIETLGRPLSIAISKTFNPAGKLKEVHYFVGNDDSRSIDVYYEKNAKFHLVGQYRVGVDGIQALDMFFDEEQNQLFVVDGLTREVKVLQPDGQLIRSFGADILVDPKGITLGMAADEIEIYVSDYGPPGSFATKASVQIFDMEGAYIRTINGKGRFSRPQGLALKGDKIYLADNMLAQILEIDRMSEGGEITSSFGCTGSSEGHLLLPMDVVLGDAGQSLYVADNRNMRITVLPLTQP